MSPYPHSKIPLATVLELASTISECARNLNELLPCDEIAEPKQVIQHSPTSASRLSKVAEEDLIATHSRLEEACDQLQHFVTGPHGHIAAIAQSHRIEAALQYANHFRLATYVPVQHGSRISFAELSRQAGVSTQQCTRVLRLLISCHIFAEPEIGTVAHTTDSRLLLDADIEAMVGYWTDESFRAGAFFTQAAEKWPGSQERNETALNMAFDTNLPKFSFFDAHSWRAERFRKAMAGMTRGDRFRLDHLVNGFEWSSLPKDATVVDIGGGGGHCSTAIAIANPKLNFIVQDLKSAFDAVVVPNSLKGRISFMEHDFFTSQPIRGQVYLLRWILHDYSDKFACKILQAQLSAMRPGTKLVVMDAIMQPPGTKTKVNERKSR